MKLLKVKGFVDEISKRVLLVTKEVKYLTGGIK